MSPKTHTLLCLSGIFGLPFLIAGCTDSVVEDSQTVESSAEPAERIESVTGIERLVVNANGSIGHEDVDFKEAINSKDGIVLVDFWATWCGPCVGLAPELEKLAAEHAGAITIVKVDVDKAEELAQEFGVSSIPDMRVFKGGEQIDAMVGGRSAEDIAAKIGL
ncbi:UNVERIFIED_CONTAM: hypothetical protein GTU68_050292 [Idotea baltica]|nr:hypothetical protein [Idotea baltica]